MAIYNQIGVGYDLSRQADPQLLDIMARLLMLREGGAYVDIGCGTGNYTVELSRLGGKWSAFDQSELMIAEAKLKSSGVGWDVCDVERTIYKQNSFHAALCSLAIHHFQNLESAFSEVDRILYPSGRFVIFTSTPEQMQGYWLNHYFPQMLARSMAQMPSKSKIEQALVQAKLELVGYETYGVSKELKDLFLYSGKFKPEIYLSASVRAGVSSFRNFCSDEELIEGLQRLSMDIYSGTIHKLIQQYENNIGDYVFVVAEKSR